jgi:predicted DNA-binding antitoxin AbrB/MazE fold protein
MKETVPAVYEEGRFRPLKPVNLREDQHVTISIEVQGEDECLVLDRQQVKWGLRRIVQRLAERIAEQLRGGTLTVEEKEWSDLPTNQKDLREPEEALSLETLLSAMTPENSHRETDWGEPRGRESC